MYNVEVFLKYCFVYLIIMSNSIFIGYKCSKKLAQTIAPSVMMIMILTYGFGLLKQLRVGVAIISIICIVLGVYAIIKMILGKKIKKYLKENIAVLIIFSTIFFLFGFTTYDRLFTAADDYGYWSMAAKNMYYLDDFITNENAVIKTVYPPFPTILQYFFEKIIGEDRQGIQLFASMIFGFSLLMPLFKNLKKQRKIAVLSLFAIVLAIPAIFAESFFYGMIYVDTLYGLLLGYLLLEYYTSEKDKFLYFIIGLSLAVISLIKPTGLFIAVITVLILLIDYGIHYMMNRKTNKIKENIKGLFKWRNIFPFIILILIPIFALGSWELYKSFSETTNIYESAEKDYEGSMIVYFLKTLYSVFTGFNNSTHADVLSHINIFSHIFDTTAYSNHPLKLTAGIWLILYAIVSIIIYKKILKNNTNGKFKAFMLAVFAGTFIYICFLQVAYVIKFPNYEAISHASIERYIGSYLIMILIVLIGVLVEYLNNIDYSKCKYLLLTFTILIFTPIQPIANMTLVAGGTNNLIKEGVSFIINLADETRARINENSKVYAFDQNSDISENITKFKYYIYPIKIEQIGKFEELYDDVKIAKEVNEFKNNLYQYYDYVIILDTDEYFNAHFKELFRNEEIYSWTLYKIEKKDEDIELVPMYTEQTKSYMN